MEYFLFMFLNILTLTFSMETRAKTRELQGSKEVLPLKRVWLGFLIPYCSTSLPSQGVEIPDIACTLSAMDHSCQRTNTAWWGAPACQGGWIWEVALGAHPIRLQDRLVSALGRLPSTLGKENQGFHDWSPRSTSDCIALVDFSSTELFFMDFAG